MKRNSDRKKVFIENKQKDDKDLNELDKVEKKTGAEIFEQEEEVLENDTVKESKELVAKTEPCSNELLNTSAREIYFTCDRCDFKSERSTALKIHKHKRHKDEQYCFWLTGYLGTGYQTYIDAMSDVKYCSELSDDEVENEIEGVKMARKEAWMKTFGNITSCNM